MWEYKYQKGKPESEFNIQTVEIIKKHCPDYSSVFEIGAGRAEISKLLYKPDEMKLTVLDSSESACAYMKQYFIDNNVKANIIKADIFEFYKQRYNPVYSTVISSGLIEHFQGGKLELLVKIHKSYSMKYLIIVCPHATKEEINFSKSEKCIKQYGFQKAYLPEELNKLFEDDKWSLVHNEIFYTADKLLCGIYIKK